VVGSGVLACPFLLALHPPSFPFSLLPVLGDVNDKCLSSLLPIHLHSLPFTLFGITTHPISYHSSLSPSHP